MKKGKVKQLHLNNEDGKLLVSKTRCVRNRNCGVKVFLKSVKNKNF